MADYYDFPIEPLPKELETEFPCEVDGKHYKYNARAFDLEWHDNSSIEGVVTITKWHKVMWLPEMFSTSCDRKVWSFSSPKGYILDWEGDLGGYFSVRGNLLEVAMNAGICLTEQLMDQMLGGIEEALQDERERLIELQAQGERNGLHVVST